MYGSIWLFAVYSWSNDFEHGLLMGFFILVTSLVVGFFFGSASQALPLRWSLVGIVTSVRAQLAIAMVSVVGICTITSSLGSSNSTFAVVVLYFFPLHGLLDMSHPLMNSIHPSNTPL